MTRITRRRLLTAGVAAGALAAGAGATTVVGLAPAEGARVLSSRELEVVRAIAEVMFPGAPFPVDGVQAGVAEEVDRLVAEILDPIHANGFRTLLHTLEWGTLASRGTPFSRLSRADRDEVLRTWADPAVFTRRIAGDAFKAVLGMAYFAHPAVLAHMGWSTGCGGGPS